MCFPKLVVVDVSIWLMLSSLSLFWEYFVNSLWEFFIPSTCITQSVHQYLATHFHAMIFWIVLCTAHIISAAMAGALGVVEPSFVFLFAGLGLWCGVRASVCSCGL